MPYIRIETNVNLDKNEEAVLEMELAKSICLLEGKDERWLMTHIHSRQTMRFQGIGDPCVMAIVLVYGKGNSYSSFVSVLTDILAKVLNVQRQRVYISCFETEQWAWNGQLF